MKRALIALMVLALAVPAFAGQNPNIRAFISFDTSCDPGPYIHRTDVCTGFVDSYFVLDNFGPDGGMRQVSMTWTTSGFGMAFAAVYYLPGAQAIGGPDNVEDGWVISGNDCVYPNECGIVVVLKQTYFVNGPGTITITPNPVDGTLVTDCLFDADFYCVLANGGLCMDPPAGDCPPPSPVEDSTWGSIKALYR
jgi:hypothetical protein